MPTGSFLFEAKKVMVKMFILNYNKKTKKTKLEFFDKKELRIVKEEHKDLDTGEVLSSKILAVGKREFIENNDKVYEELVLTLIMRNQKSYLVLNKEDLKILKKLIGLDPATNLILEWLYVF